MKLTKRTLALAIASALGVSSTAAMAIVDLSGTTQGDPIYYPSEVNIENGITVDGVSTGDAEFTPKYNLQAGNSIWALVELSGATIATGDQWDTGAISTNNSNVSVIFTEGGAGGESSAIFQLKADSGNLTSSDTFTLYFNSNNGSQMSIASASGVTARVRLYNDPTSAQLANDQNVRDYSGQIIGFKSGVSAMMKPNGSASTASVDTNFAQFVSGDQAGSASLTDLGGIVYAPTSGVMDINSGTQVTLADMFDASTSLTLEGDFSAASSVYIDPTQDGTCTTTGAVMGTIVDDTTATFAIGNTAIGSESAGSYTYGELCFAADGTTAMDASEYTATLDGVAATGSQYNVGNAGPQGEYAGAIDRDGVVLRTGFVSKAYLRVSRFIFANSGVNDAEITDVRIYDKSDGTNATSVILPLPYVLTAGSRTAIDMTSLINIDSMPQQNVMVEFSIGSTNDKIFGTYQLLLQNSLVQTIVPLERLPSSYGQ
jgi:hypothetical protein